MNKTVVRETYFSRCCHLGTKISVHSGDRAALLGSLVSQNIEKESVMQATHLFCEGFTGCFKIN
jgi:hypothetical protein